MSDYPKMLYHPAWSVGTPAKTDKDPQGRVIGVGARGVPCRYPPVTVVDEDEEGRYRAAGYMGQGEHATLAKYSEFPKMLVHPGHVDAVPDAIDMKKDDDGNLVRLVIPGKPEKHPHVFVKDADEQAKWEAKGYELPGKMDPVHAVDAMVDHIEGYDPQQWPKMEGGRIVDPYARQGGPEEYPKWVNGQVVNNAAEEDALLADLGELTDAKIERAISHRLAASVRGDDAEVERIEAELLEQGIALKDKPHGTVWSRIETGKTKLSDGAKLPADDPRSHLIAEAKSKGIRVHHKWSLEKLQEALKAA